MGIACNARQRSSVGEDAHSTITALWRDLTAYPGCPLG